MNAINIITRDHRAIEDAYDDYMNAADEDEKAAAASALFTMLEAHAKMEEMYFYPIIEEGKVGQGLVSEARDKQADIKHALAQAKMADMDTLDGRMAELMDTVAEHVEDEEANILPQIEKDIRGPKLDVMGKLMEPHSASVESSALERSHS